jgi:hypothetical protein
MAVSELRRLQGGSAALVYRGVAGWLPSLGSHRGKAPPPPLLPILAVSGEAFPIFSLPIEKIFQINSKNIKISLVDWKKSGYNKME